MICSRRGVSLIELLVVMTASTMVLTLTSVVLVRAMHAQMQSRAHVDAERSALRLSEQLRRDAHQSKAATTGPANLAGDVFLQLDSPDGQNIEYSRVGGNVQRSALKNGRTVAREEFSFPANYSLRVSVLEDPHRLMLMITSNADVAATAKAKSLADLTAIPVILNVEAVLGYNRRFDAIARTQEMVP